MLFGLEDFCIDSGVFMVFFYVNYNYGLDCVWFNWLLGYSWFGVWVVKDRNIN